MTTKITIELTVDQSRLLLRATGKKTRKAAVRAAVARIAAEASDLSELPAQVRQPEREFREKKSTFRGR